MTVTEERAEMPDHRGSWGDHHEGTDPVLTIAIQKLALASEQAGFTVEQVIEVLETGMSVETFLNLVCSQIELSQAHPEASCWEFHHAQTVPVGSALRWLPQDLILDCVETLGVTRERPCRAAGRRHCSGSARNDHPYWRQINQDFREVETVRSPGAPPK